MKQMLLDHVAEERRIKTLGRVLNLVLFGVSLSSCVFPLERS